MLIALILILVVLFFIALMLWCILYCNIKNTANIESLYDVIAKTSAKEIAEKFIKQGYKLVKDE